MQARKIPCFEDARASRSRDSARIARVTAYAKVASVPAPTLATKRVSPHTVRHATAVHLLRAGVDINTIRAWLGHFSLDSTHVYAEVDLDMKAKALASLDISDLPTSACHRRSMPSLMQFLRGL